MVAAWLPCFVPLSILSGGFFIPFMFCLFIFMQNNAILSLEETVPVTEPVTLTEAKAWIKVADSYTDDDTIITALIVTARTMLEKYLSISIASKTYTVVLKSEMGWMELPYCPFISLTSAADSDGDALTNGTDFEMDGEAFKRLITPYDYIKLVYVAGYSTVPQALKDAIKMQAGFMYEHRGDELDSTAMSKDAIMVAKSYSRHGIYI